MGERGRLAQLLRPSGLRPSVGKAALLGALLWLGALGCRTAPLRFGPGGEIRDARRLLALLDARSETLRTFTAEGRISAHGPRGGGTTGIEVAASRPASLRLEIDGFFGSPVAILATDGRRLEIFQVDRGIFATGPATAPNLGRLLAVPLAPDLGVGILLGDPPRLAADRLSLRVDPARRAYVLTLEGGGRRQILLIDTETLDLMASRVEGPDGYEAGFDAHRSAAGIDIPRRIFLAVGTPPTSVELTYRSVELNGELDPSLFEIAPPAGALVVPLGP